MADNASSTFNNEPQPSTSPTGLDVARPATVILRLPAVKLRTGLSRATIYRKMQAREFPVAKRLSANCVGWVGAEIETWLTERVPAGGGR